jgi:Uma2 family endonuclease
MAVAAFVPLQPGAVPVQPRDVDQRVILHGISWRDYSVLRDLLEDSAVRMTYLEGALEIMSPSRLHEDVKKRIARLLELFALERNVQLQGYGSMTLRHEPKGRGLEPDECYVVGPPRTEGFPDLAIEVSVTTGGIDKLEVYRGFGVREVWIWVEGHITVYGLTGTGYVERPASEVVPGIDLSGVARFAAEPNQHEAVMAYRASLRDEEGR